MCCRYHNLTRPSRHRSALRPRDWEAQEDPEEVLPNADILPELTNPLLPGKHSKEQPLIAEVCALWGETQPLSSVWEKLSCSQRRANAAWLYKNKGGKGHCSALRCLITEKEDKLLTKEKSCWNCILLMQETTNLPSCLISYTAYWHIFYTGVNIRPVLAIANSRQVGEKMKWGFWRTTQ